MGARDDTGARGDTGAHRPGPRHARSGDNKKTGYGTRSADNTLRRRIFIGAAIGGLGVAALGVGAAALTDEGLFPFLRGGGAPTGTSASEASPTNTPTSSALTSASPTETPAPTPTPAPTEVRSVAPAIERVQLPAPGRGVYSLPVTGPFTAWTVDDGSDADVIRAYATFAKETGTRLTFFPNAKYEGWKTHAGLIRPLVESGQVAIGNHTYNHVDLTSLSDQGIIDELTRNEEALVALYGSNPKPFYRPPFGYRNDRTDAVAASIGYTTPVMWYGSIADSGLIPADQLLGFADKWFQAGSIVIGHANFPTVTTVFPQLHQLLVDRGLQTVTLRDVFLT